MKTLFAPWRYQFISKPKTDTACFLCDAASEPEDADRLVVHGEEHFVVVLNRYPYNNGHIMVAPRAHVAEPESLGAESVAAFWPLVIRCKRVLERVYHPDGLNLGMNLGSAAGAGLQGHMHLHLVPRWEGDVNFMTALGEARVIPEDLQTTRQRLVAAFQQEGHDERQG
jgi:ATP adenylyltransferase